VRIREQCIEMVARRKLGAASMRSMLIWPATFTEGAASRTCRYKTSGYEVMGSMMLCAIVVRSMLIWPASFAEAAAPENVKRQRHLI
jgi:hypothetical protein